MQRRARLFRRGRMAVLALVIAYFFLPYSIQAVIPVWLLFLAALGLEVEFFLGGYRQAQRGQPAVELDRGPQQRDLSELGRWAWWESDPAIALQVDDSRFRWIHFAEAAVGIVARRGNPLLRRAAQGLGRRRDPLTARAPRLSSRTRPRSSQATRREIGCDASGEYVGFVQEADGLAFVGGDQAYLTPSICNTLYQLRFKHRSEPFSHVARALAVLGHESQHLRGVRDEGLANCYGYQSGVEIGVHLGLSEKTARAMMREQLATNASDSGLNVQYRVPSGCRDGGTADLHPNSAGFP